MQARTRARALGGGRGLRNGLRKSAGVWRIREARMGGAGREGS